MEAHSLNELWPVWKIESEIGKGSYGTVFKAVNEVSYSGDDAAVKSEAAIKVISITKQSYQDLLQEEGIREENEVTSFLMQAKDDCIKEIDTLNRLKRLPNIVPIEDYGIITLNEGREWEIAIRMPLLESYDSFREKHPGVLDLRTVLKIGIDISEALVACEQNGIIHRDIKPANIFYDTKTKSFLLGDFGIARSLEKVKASRTQRGTPNYIAPEVSRGGIYDMRADQYSLGLVLYRFLNADRPPFVDPDGQVRNIRRDAQGNIMKPNDRRLSGEQLPPPAGVSCPPPLVQLILRACDPVPERRFPSARALNAALKREAQKLNQQGRNGADTDDQTMKLRPGPGGGTMPPQPQPQRGYPSGDSVPRNSTGYPRRSDRSGDYGRADSQGSGNSPRWDKPGMQPSGGQWGRPADMTGTRVPGTEQEAPKKKSKAWIVILIAALVVILGAGGYFAYQKWLKPVPVETAVQNEGYTPPGPTPAVEESSMRAEIHKVSALTLDPGLEYHMIPNADAANVTSGIKNITEVLTVDAVSADGGWGHLANNSGYIELRMAAVAEDSWPVEQPLESERLPMEVRYIVENVVDPATGLRISPNDYVPGTAAVENDNQVLVQAFRTTENGEWAFACLADRDTKEKTNVAGWIPTYYLR